ncbi:MAG: hypothetical protein J6A08_11605 [Lachnospiraceae bacterium]|nr:hypothetical protein [Lachnospiraceae bacterium]
MGISLNGLNSGLADTYSSLLGGGSSSSDSGVSSILADYASIKNGSYGKLMKSYYAKAKAEAEDDESGSSAASSSKEKDTLTASSASSAYKAAEKLLTTDFSEENLDEAYDAVSDFVKQYNSLIKNGTSSSNSSVRKQAQYLYDTMYSNYKLFAKIGITLNTDRTLSLDEDTFKDKGNYSTMKTLFNGSNSFADKVSYKASQMYRYANEGKSITAKTYTSSGTYSATNTSDSTIDSAM